MTRQLREAAKSVGIPLLDHVIVGCGTGRYQVLAHDTRWNAA